MIDFAWCHTAHLWGRIPTLSPQQSRKYWYMKGKWYHLRGLQRNPCTTGLVSQCRRTYIRMRGMQTTTSQLNEVGYHWRAGRTSNGMIIRGYWNDDSGSHSIIRTLCTYRPATGERIDPPINCRTRKKESGILNSCVHRIETVLIWSFNHKADHEADHEDDQLYYTPCTAFTGFRKHLWRRENVVTISNELRRRRLKSPDIRLEHDRIVSQETGRMRIVISMRMRRQICNWSRLIAGLGNQLDPLNLMKSG